MQCACVRVRVRVRVHCRARVRACRVRFCARTRACVSLLSTVDTARTPLAAESQRGDVDKPLVAIRAAGLGV